MKPIIIAPIAFIVGVAGGTFLAKAPEPPPGAVTDSSHVTPPADSETPPLAVDDSSSHAAGADTSGHPPVTAAESPPVEAPAPAFDAARLSQILNKLPPADVPPLVIQFPDHDLVQVLRQVSVAHSAAVIAALPKERAANVSKLLLSLGRVP